MPKIKTTIIKSLKGYISHTESLVRKHDNPFWFRGCGEASQELKPSLFRHKKSTKIASFMDLEKHLISRFSQRSIPFHSRSFGDDWDRLFFMQHYGVPTRLLDWSESPLMALFFAVTSSAYTFNHLGKPVFKNDAAIWILDPNRWNKKAFQLKSYDGEILSTDNTNVNAYKPKSEIATMKDFPIAILGAHNSQRIVSQRGVFVCFGKDIRPMETIYKEVGFPSGSLTKLIIKKEDLPHMHSALKRHGITDSVAFPDLDGLAREIKREFSFEV